MRSIDESRSDGMRIEFLDGELDLCQTFLDVADNESGHPEKVTSARAKAQIGYETALAWIGSVEDQQNADRLQAKLERLRQRLGRAPILSRLPEIDGSGMSVE